MHDTAFANLEQTLKASYTGTLAVTALAQAWRGERALLAALPPRYGAVLDDILGRLESGGLFSEESCSFSQRDLLDALADWLDKARSMSTQATSK
jgi:hypothetical protein